MGSDPDSERHAPVPASDAAALPIHADPRITVGTYSLPNEEDKKRELDRIVGDEDEEE